MQKSQSLRVQMLGSHWARAEATIIAKQPRPMTGGYEQTYNYVVDVHPLDGPPIRATIHEGFLAPDGGLADPAIGDTVGVLYDAKHQKVKFDNADPRLSLAPGKQAAADAFAEAATAAPGTALPAGAFSGQVVPTINLSGDSVSSRLAKLERLRDSGLLDEASYRSARQSIIGSQ
jgi:hypothetical protein